jgi:hypothetical protein
LRNFVEDQTAVRAFRRWVRVGPKDIDPGSTGAARLRIPAHLRRKECPEGIFHSELRNPGPFLYFSQNLLVGRLAARH